ncbi:hypothetical protein EAI_15503 [Harpegnathos saltator]|uniref:Uncharacterized protein n=1 Tax=Harpegnathos saltator TaxID=610380 RepID=E2BIP3_HARSA|nr:hypothetical protein EAI_15503 [Harpegnathos saltator]
MGTGGQASNVSYSSVSQSSDGGAYTTGSGPPGGDRTGKGALFTREIRVQHATSLPKDWLHRCESTLPPNRFNRLRAVYIIE